MSSEAWFFVAAERGNVDEVRRLVEHERIDPELNDLIDSLDLWRIGWTALHYASFYGHLSILAYLLEEQQVHVDVVCVACCETPLHLACRSPVLYHGPTRGLNVVKYLVEVGHASVEALDEDKDTPLHNASYHGNLQVVQYLIEERHANIRARNKKGFTPFDLAYRCDQIETIRYLLPLYDGDIALDEYMLQTAFLKSFPWDIKHGVLSAYAQNGLGCDNESFSTFPLHMIFRCPLRPKHFEDCITHFGTSCLATVNKYGCLPLHVALNSTVTTARFPSLFVTLLKRELRSALTRDPTTGLYPFETAAIKYAPLDAKKTWPSILHANAWTDVVYRFLRINPEYLLSTRGFIMGGGVSSKK